MKNSSLLKMKTLTAMLRIATFSEATATLGAIQNHSSGTDNVELSEKKLRWLRIVAALGRYCD